MSQTLYREAIGSLIFLSTVTRTDISYSVGAVMQHCEDPRNVHWNAVKRIFKYLKQTNDFGLLYTVNSEDFECVNVCSDANYARCEINRKSITGYVIKIGNNVVSWGSRKQSVAVLSTAEAEYIAACVVMQELVWMKRLTRELLFMRKIPCILYVDNKNAIDMIKKPVFNRRTKHIDVRYHYIRDMYLKGKFVVEYVSTHEQQAGVLTNPFLETVLNISEEHNVCN